MNVQHRVCIGLVCNKAWENECFATPCWCFWYLGEMLKIEYISACMHTSGSNFISQKQRMVFTFSTLQVIATVLRFPLFALWCIDFSLAILSVGDTWLPLSRLLCSPSSWITSLLLFCWFAKCWTWTEERGCSDVKLRDSCPIWSAIRCLQHLK